MKYILTANSDGSAELVDLRTNKRERVDLDEQVQRKTTTFDVPSTLKAAAWKVASVVATP